MTPYQIEQLECLKTVREYFSLSPETELAELRERIVDYLSFRRTVQSFLFDHFNSICDSKCYQNRLSACCSRDGIVTFFADVAVNALISSSAELDRIVETLQKPHEGFKCVYLGAAGEGCLWRLKPIVCEMFLCDEAEQKVFKDNPEAQKKWDELNIIKKRYAWPDRPVLFDDLEQLFLDAGYHCSLMYLHNSPGLLRVKEMARTKAPG